MVCDYETRGEIFIPGKPRLWTETRIGDNAHTSSVHATFLLNFFDELKRRRPNGGGDSLN